MTDRVFSEAAGAYLDVENVGSSIRYSTYVELVHRPKTGRASYKYLSGEVSLTDCNRVITWSFSDGAAGIEKIDAAIKQLRAFRKSLVTANKIFDKVKVESSE